MSAIQTRAKRAATCLEAWSKGIGPHDNVREVAGALALTVRALMDALQQAGAPWGYGWTYDSVGHAVVGEKVVTSTPEPTIFLSNVFARGPVALYASPLPQQTALVEGPSPELDEINGRLA